MAQCTDRMDGMDRDQIRNAIEQGNTALGIEFGSTRIKAVLVDGKNKPIAQGSYDWENRFEEGIWTYRLADAQTGLISCFRSLKEDVNKKYDITLHTIGAMGVSAMMHGYMAFDQNQKTSGTIQDLEKHHDSGGFPKTDRNFSLSNSPAMEYSASVSGNFKRRKTR